MEHEEVVKTVKNWLKREHPPPRRVAEGSHADLLVITDHIGSVTYHLQVECKKTEDYAGPSIGMCLHYYAERDGLFTYLAVPEDYQHLKELQHIFRLVTLPIGLIVVHNDGKVEIVKKAEGKERTMQL